MSVETKLVRSFSISGDHGETKILEINNKVNYNSTDENVKIKHSGLNSSEDMNPHCHVGLPEERMDKRARRKLVLASILCLLFMIGEVVGGVLANSLAIATDAAHLLTDFASFMISLFAIYLASRPPTKRMSFGWYRAEVMGALISVLLIWVVTGVLVYMAVERVVSGDYEIDATVMLITAGVGVGVNLLMGCTLHDHGHSHGGGSHGHSHGRTSSSTSSSSSSSDPEADDCRDEEKKALLRKEKAKENINVRAAFIHVVGDFIQSVGVFIAALIIYLKPEWKLADPICTFLFSVLVLITTITILRDTLLVLMEGAPRGMKFSEVKNSLASIPGVKKVHNLRIWSLTMAKTALAVHLALERGINPQSVLMVAGNMMRDKYSIYECTIQVEQYVSTMKDCEECKEPED